MEPNKKIYNEDEIEIDLADLFFYLFKKKWVILLSTLVAAVIGLVISGFIMTPKYTASSRIYVLNKSNENTIAVSDVQMSKELLNDYKVLITGNNVTKEVIKELKLDIKPEALAKKIEVTAPDNTRILQISVTDEDPKLAADTANIIWKIAGTQLQSIMGVDAVNLVYSADMPTIPSSPNVIKNTILAAAFGFILAIAFFIVAYLLNDKIKTEEDVEKYLGISTFGSIPDSEIFGELGASRKLKKKNKFAFWEKI